MALNIQKLQFVWAILIAVQENVPAMPGEMVFPPFRPPGLGAAKCIESHTFGSGEHTIQLKPRCEGGCSEKKPEDGDKCVMESETSGPVLIFLSGVCQNMTCKINNESEIYKQEMNESLDNNGVYKVPIPQLPGCGFTNVQDKNRLYFLSMECTACESLLNQTKRPDCTPCIVSKNDTESGDVKLTVGECQNGTCVALSSTKTVDVDKELISNSGQLSKEQLFV
uniref:Putative secreted protein n=1 Tax=Ixodes ricinus TaxID=34613 RepID=A0A0K8R7M2_IXORI